MKPPVVIDVGCASYGGRHDSIPQLLQRYDPDLLIGYDPSGEQTFPIPTRPGQIVRIFQVAAWTYDGHVGFVKDGMVGRVAWAVNGDDPTPELVTCVDLAPVVASFWEEGVILKLDCEGGEYALLEHLLDTGASEQLKRVLVEWHPLEGGPPRRRQIEARLRHAGIPVEQWT